MYLTFGTFVGIFLLLALTLSHKRLCVAVQPRGAGYGQEPVGIHLFLVRDVHGDGCELLGGERVPVSDVAAEVLLGVVVVAPLGQPHRRHVLIHMHNAAMTEKYNVPIVKLTSIGVFNTVSIIKQRLGHMNEVAQSSKYTVNVNCDSDLMAMASPRNPEDGGLGRRGYLL